MSPTWTIPYRRIFFFFSFFSPKKITKINIKSIAKCRHSSFCETAKLRCQRRRRRSTMSFLQLVKRIYSLDTLDARFTANAAPSSPSGQTRSYSSSSATDSSTNFAVAATHKRPSATKAPALPIHAGGDNKEAHGSAPGSSASASPPEAQPSKWNTYEYHFYCFCLVIAVPWMWKTGMDISTRTVSCPFFSSINQR